MFLVLLCESRGMDEPLWSSPREAENRFALSEDTGSKGLRELADAGLIITKRRSVNQTDFEAEALHLRNVHFLQASRLNETALVEPRRRVIRIVRKSGDPEPK